MKPIHPLERFLATLGAIACVVITLAVWRSVSPHQDMWPLPGLYFLEVVLLAIFCAFLFTRQTPPGPILTWAAVGMFLAFCIMGALSVGFSYLPVALIFAIVAASSSIRHQQPLLTSLAAFLVAALLQAALMFTAIRLIYPG